MKMVVLESNHTIHYDEFVDYGSPCCEMPARIEIGKPLPQIVFMALSGRPTNQFPAKHNIFNCDVMFWRLSRCRIFKVRTMGSDRYKV